MWENTDISALYEKQGVKKYDLRMTALLTVVSGLESMNLPIGSNQLWMLGVGQEERTMINKMTLVLCMASCLIN